jgi:hypothetical protein
LRSEISPRGKTPRRGIRETGIPAPRAFRIRKASLELLRVKRITTAAIGEPARKEVKKRSRRFGNPLHEATKAVAAPTMEVRKRGKGG